MTQWIDSHNHLQDARLGDPAPVIAAMKKAGVFHCVVNATCEEDWETVANLASTHGNFISPAFGIHPWKAQAASAGWQERLKLLLAEHPCASIGECGLDAWITSPSLEIQRPVFIEQLRLGREIDRPITIHCLKAWGALFECFAAAPPPSRFLMHSYGGSIETARRLVSLGAFLSFSGHFLHPRKSAVLEVFRQLPQDRILLETDAPDMVPPAKILTHPLPGNYNHPANLPAIGHALAAEMGMTPQTLADLTRENAGRCFGSGLISD